MWNKLKHEWKTLAWGAVSTALELEMYSDPTALDFLIPEEQRGLVHVAIPVGFFLLRRWKDRQTDV